MIEISSISCDIRHYSQIRSQEDAWVRGQACKLLHIQTGEIDQFEIMRKSHDARHKDRISVLWRIRLSLLAGKEQELAYVTRAKDLTSNKALRINYCEPAPEPVYPAHTSKKPDVPPVIVGAGCAGLFAALTLAHKGLCPILVERGEEAKARASSIKRFIEHAQLDENSNIQFGAGGAGTFSDGKLGTGTKSPLHRLILKTFVSAGAQPHILYDAKPHIGSDILPRVVTHIVAEIERLGGRVLFSHKMTRLEIQNGRVCGVYIEDCGAHSLTKGCERSIKTRHVILAQGHSARDTLIMLKDVGVYMERKTFAMGVRIEHLQEAIDQAQYKYSARARVLGAADYKAAVHLPNGRSAFSFCMCPGGYVVAATSARERVVTNGMSLSTRAGKNANAGFLSNVLPQDLPGDDVLAGMYLQDRCEKKAFELGGEDYKAPAQLVGDFIQNKASTQAGRVSPSYSLGVKFGSIYSCLPAYITDTLAQALPLIARKLTGFDAQDAVLTACETRSSSPVRLTRDEHLQAIGIEGLWPAGEGAGYAGGIMSAATDGIRAAQALIKSME